MPVMHTPPRHRRRMGGFALMQLSILLAVLSILGVVAAQQLINELDELQAEAAGSYAQSIKNALDQYLTENQLALHNNLPVTGFADPLAPTVQELRNAKYLYSSFPLVDPMRRRYAAQIRRIACPGPGCEVSALAFVNMPLTQRCTGFAADGACTATAGEVKHRIVEAIRSHSRGYGAAVTLLAPDRYRGSVCDYATPTGAAVGTYGVCTSDNAAIYAQFVRIGDHRDPDLQGKLTIAGETTIASTLTVSALASAEALRPTGTVTIGASCTAAEAGTMRQAASGGGTNSPLAVCTGSSWTSLGGNKVANYGDSCSVQDETALTPTDQALICRGGSYYYLSSFFGKYLLVDTQYSGHGSVIDKPTCNVNGVPYIVLVPGTESSDDGTFSRYVNDNGSSWTIQMVDALGDPLSSASVIAQIYCEY